MSICQHPLPWGIGFVSEWRFYERCLSLRLCIFYQTSLRSGGCPCLCQTSVSEQSVLTGSERCLIVRCLFQSKKRKLDGIFALCHTCLTNRQSHCKQGDKNIYTPAYYPSSAEFSQLWDWQLVCTVWQSLSKLWWMQWEITPEKPNFTPHKTVHQAANCYSECILLYLQSAAVMPKQYDRRLYISLKSDVTQSVSSFPVQPEPLLASTVRSCY